ncbi:hypothetical protein S245_061593, partial [Arachis hypogaea]
IIYTEEWKKLRKNRTIIQYLSYVIRWGYLATMFTEEITVNGPEQLKNIQVPQRATCYIRVIMLELSRIASHLLWLGLFMADIGAQIPLYIFRERELIYDLFEAAIKELRLIYLMGLLNIKNLL